MCHERERRGLAPEQEMVVAVERDEFGTRYLGGKLAAGRQRDTAIAARVHHKRRRLHVLQDRADVDIGKHFEIARGVLGVDGLALEDVEPVEFLGGRARQAGLGLRGRAAPQATGASSAPSSTAGAVTRDMKATRSASSSCETPWARPG